MKNIGSNPGLQKWELALCMICLCLTKARCVLFMDAVMCMRVYACTRVLLHTKLLCLQIFVRKVTSKQEFRAKCSSSVRNDLSLQLVLSARKTTDDPCGNDPIQSLWGRGPPKQGHAHYFWQKRFISSWLEFISGIYSPITLAAKKYVFRSRAM